MLLEVFAATSEPLTNGRLTSVDQLAAAIVADHVAAAEVSIATFVILCWHFLYVRSPVLVVA